MSTEKKPKLSEEVEKYFYDYVESDFDSDCEIVDAVKALEDELGEARAERDAAVKERDFATPDEIRLCECGCGMVAPTDCPTDVAYRATAEKCANCGRFLPCRHCEDDDYETVTREVVLFTDFEGEERIDPVDLFESERNLGVVTRNELARATVTFRVKKPAPKTLAERLDDWFANDGVSVLSDLRATLGRQFLALVDEVRDLEKKVSGK